MPTIKDFINAGIPLKLDECDEAEQRFSFGEVTPKQQKQIMDMLRGDAPIVFTQPVHAFDFVVSTTDIDPDPEKALLNAIAEMEKGEGEPKSLDLIVRSTFKALKHAMKEIDKLRLDVEQLKKKVK